MKKSYKVFLGIIITIILAIAVLLVRVIYLNSINQFDPDYEILLENTKFLNTPIDIKKINLDRFIIPTIGIYSSSTPYIINRLLVNNSELYAQDLFFKYYRYYYKFSRYSKENGNCQTINFVNKFSSIKGKYHFLLITNDSGVLDKKSVFIAWDNSIPKKSEADNWDYRSNYYSITNTTRIIYSNLNKAELQKLFPEFDGIVKKHYPKKITINYEKMPKSSEDNIDEHIQFEW